MMESNVEILENTFFDKCCIEIYQKYDLPQLEKLLENIDTDSSVLEAYPSYIFYIEFIGTEKHKELLKKALKNVIWLKSEVQELQDLTKDYFYELGLQCLETAKQEREEKYKQFRLIKKTS